jgi:molybdopterin/thiamine biosynthesis adenylyltransferase
MLLVLLMAAAIWGFGGLAGVPRRTRWLALAGLYVAVLLEQVLLPAGHPLRQATGESPALWLLIGGFGLLGVAYAMGLRWLKARIRPVAAPAPEPATPPAGGFTPETLERYARHIMLREIGGPGQKRLAAARVLVIGAGGLGAPLLQYLAAAGVGTIGVVDDDAVDNSNLQRQVIHGHGDIGTPKVFSAADSMVAINPAVEVRPYHRRFTPDMAETLLADYDLIVDGTDNFDARYLANEVATRLGKPLVSGALSQWEGQVCIFDPAQGTPCYRCVFPEAPAPGLAPSCAEAGVAGPLPGVIGSIMALEVVKLLTGAGDPLRGRMLIYDGLYGETRQIALSRRPDCPVCGEGAG